MTITQSKQLTPRHSAQSGSLSPQTPTRTLNFQQVSTEEVPSLSPDSLEKDKISKADSHISKVKQDLPLISESLQNFNEAKNSSNTNQEEKAESKSFINSSLRSRRGNFFGRKPRFHQAARESEKSHDSIISMITFSSTKARSHTNTHTHVNTSEFRNQRICGRMCCPPPGKSEGSSEEERDDESHNSSLADSRQRIWVGTLAVMNVFAKLLLWFSGFATIAAVVWYSVELKNNGTDPHLIAWFSSGAFVLLGFPISIYGIFMHLSNYYQPSIQCYVVRILWMVPVYSIESWLCLRFRQHAIYIETARDCYESFVLYSFLQYLEQVLGGERELVLMLKDKSPTRGVHISPMHWCIKPWLMGQPETVTKVEVHTAGKKKRRKQVQWTSPFYIKCKFGVLQYVVLKLLTAIITMILVLKDLYKEGDFSPKGGYLWLCLITNTSQCWALYCLIFFYNATKTELAPIRPVGKFLSVKCIVFFTWWQSLFIGILVELDLIPSYSEWSMEEVAKGLQAYLICIEMFAAAIVHTFVFPHTDYLGGRKGLVMGADIHRHHVRYHRLGRKNHQRRMKENIQSGSGIYNVGVQMTTMTSSDWDEESFVQSDTDDAHSYSHLAVTTGLNSGNKKEMTIVEGDIEQMNTDAESDLNSPSLSKSEQKSKKTNFVRAFLDSAVPRDVVDNTVGIVKGEFSVEKKTLLHHAATSDDYDLFSAKRRQRILATNSKEKGHGSSSGAPKTLSMKNTRPSGSRIKSKMNMNEFL